MSCHNCDLSATVLRLMCGVSGPVNVSCTVTGREVESVVCSYDNGAIVEDCKQNNDNLSAINGFIKIVFQVRLTLP